MSEAISYPSEWRSKRLAEIAAISTGGTPPTQNATLYGNDHPFVSPGDIGKSKFISTSEKMLSNLGWQGCKKFPKGAILFVCIGSTIGKLGVASRSVSANQQINGVVPNEEVDSDFLYYRLSLAAKDIRAQASEQAVPIINKSTFGGLKISLPPLKEQETIAEALSDADALIEGLERLIAKKRLIKQGAMQDLLTAKRRLPGFSGEWEIKKLGSLAQLYQPETIAQSSFSEGGYPVYGANGIVGYFARFNHSEPQLMVSCRGNCGTVNRTHGPSWITGNSMVINLHRRHQAGHFEFMFQLLSVTDFSLVTTGSGQPQIVRRPLSNMELLLPAGLDEQVAIANVFSDMDAEIQALETRLEKTRLVKEGMMQNLLTGRIRLV